MRVSSVPPDKSQALNQQLAEGVCSGPTWRTRRGRHTSNQATLKTINGSSAFWDLRIFEMDSAGCMLPTTRGVTISVTNIFELIKLIASAQGRAIALGLIDTETKK